MRCWLMRSGTRAKSWEAREGPSCPLRPVSCARQVAIRETSSSEDAARSVAFYATVFSFDERDLYRADLGVRWSDAVTQRDTALKHIAAAPALLKNGFPHRSPPGNLLPRLFHRSPVLRPAEKEWSYRCSHAVRHFRPE